MAKKRRRRIFTIQTPLAYHVFLERDRWRQIVRQKHPALAGREKEVRACLASPAVVRESAKEADVHMYYVPSGEVYLCVVIAPANANEHFVVTAYLTKNIKKGRELWTS
ncbi:MAG TPA: hypothetical protein VH682_23085 [Gemmataceae bacterium]|jgi:hypothetical protein